MPAPMTGTTTSSDDPLATALRGFGPVGILAILVVLGTHLVFPLLAAGLVLLWAWRSRTPWSAIGFSRPVRWPVVIVGGVVLGVALKLVMKSLVMPLLGAPPMNAAYHHVIGNAPAASGLALEVIVVGGFAEETIFRGFLFERLGTLWGRSTGARIATLLLTSLYFAALHYPEQGLAGAEQALFTGLTFGVLYLRLGSLWMAMVAHAAFDLFAVAIIYWDLESTFAHLVFK
jgi:membrane protease YdiL (CAAX protease family)